MKQGWDGIEFLDVKSKSETKDTELETNKAFARTFETEEHKRKTSETLKGRKRPQEVIDKIVKTRKENGGWCHSEKTKNKISSNNGMKRQEVRDKLKGREISIETRKKLSDVSVHKRACIIDGVWYESIKQASNQLDIKWGMVSDRIKSKSEKFKNWNYAE